MKVCRNCGCTDDDCRQCWEKTEVPCYWIEENLCSACGFPNEERTSESWNNVFPYIILNPDGWDRANWQFSWYEEKISFQEFNRRAIQSTVAWSSL